MSDKTGFDAEQESRRNVMLYMEGWITGAKATRLSPIIEGESPYTLGWKDGREAKLDAYRRTCMFNGIKPEKP